jgi:RNA polymerase sigma-70 factor (ECF subfamily)
MGLFQNHKNLEDEELLRKYKATKDRELLGIALQRYTMLLLGVGMKYLKDRLQAEDAVQAVFLKVITSLPQEDILNFKGWLYILMRNHCLQLLRDKNRFTAEIDSNSIADEPTDKDEQLKLEYTLEQMQAAIQQLATDQKVCVIGFYLQKKSYQQIMEETGFTFAQVKSYIQNGKRNLKIALERKK